MFRGTLSFYPTRVSHKKKIDFFAGFQVNLLGSRSGAVIIRFVRDQLICLNVKVISKVLYKCIYKN